MQPIEQVFPETAVTHALLQITMRRRDHANINGNGLAANRRDNTLLQGPQDLRLHGDVHVADLVEKQRSMLGFAKGALPVTHRACKGAANMAEQLAFHELGRDSSAIDGDERFAAAMTVVMNSARHELLAGSGLT